jgi:hypothetical protein
MSVEVSSSTNRNMRSVVERKVAQAIENGGTHAYEAWERMKEQGRMMEDWIVPINKGGRLWFNKPDQEGAPVYMVAAGRDGSDLFEKTMHKNAAEQLGNRLGIPATWLRTMVHGGDWERGAATTLLNDYAKNADGMKAMVRSVGGEVRAVLSDRYKPLDTVPVFGSFITSAYARGAKLYDGAMTDLNSYMEVLMPEVVDVHLPEGRVVHIVFGARISTSDFGKGSLEVRGFYMQGVCLNGMVRQNVLRQVHLGKRQSDTGSDMFSDQTKELQLQTVKAEVADVTEHLLSLPYREQTVAFIQRAAGIRVDIQQEVKRLKTFGLLEQEVDEIDAILLAGRMDDGATGEATAWKVSQGITAMARDKDATRKREVELIAHEYLTSLVS